MVAYATHGDLYRHGLPRGLIHEPARPIASVDAATNRLTLANHGYELDDPVQLVVEPGGALPAPLAAGTVYYARPIVDSDSLFELAATAGGAAINITDAGTGTFGIYTPLRAEIDAVLEVTSREVDDMLPAHLVPLEEPYPSAVVAAVCKITARKLLATRGERSETLIEEAGFAVSNLQKWAKGIPLRDERATGPANLAQAWSDGDRGWDLGEGRVL